MKVEFYSFLFLCGLTFVSFHVVAAEIEETNPILASLKGLARPQEKLNWISVDAHTRSGMERVSCLYDKNRSSLVMVYPGIFGSQYSSDYQARAETFYNQGYNVCLFSNSFRSGFYKDHGIVPGDLKGEAQYFWEATRSILFQAKRTARTVHFIGFSYGTQILKEILIHASRDWHWLAKNLFGKISLGKAIFISPPYSLLDSMETMDFLWRQKGPMLQNIGSLPLLQISSDVLGFAFAGKALSYSFPVEVYEAFVLRLGFYSNMQEMARELLPSNQIPSTQFGFSDYLKDCYIPLHGSDIFSPKFTEGWERITQPVLIIYSQDDYINESGSASRFDFFRGLKQNLSVLVMPRGGHMGFLNQPEVKSRMTSFFQ